MIRSLFLPILLLLVASSVSFACRGTSGTKACWANLRTIDGAIEMYNLDNNTRLFEGARLLGPEDLAPLVKGGYLQWVPKDPGQGDTYNYVHVPAKGVVCLVHGAAGGQGSAREQLAMAGVKDAALLRLALDTLPPSKQPGEVKSETITAWIGLVFLLIEITRLRTVRRRGVFAAAGSLTAIVLMAAIGAGATTGICGGREPFDIPALVLLFGATLVAVRWLISAALLGAMNHIWPTRRLKRIAA